MQDYDRLDRLAIEKYGSINKLAELLGISSQAIYDWKDKPLSRKKLERLKAIGINPEYIRTGTGEMFLGAKDNGYTTIPEGYMKTNVREVFIPYRGTLDEIINQIDLEHITMAEQRKLRQAMQEKINEIDKILRAADGE